MELRLYSLVNFYLAGMQVGIQTGHAAVDLVRKYSSHLDLQGGRITEQEMELTAEWADNHKTFICLNGGDNDMLREATDVIAKSGYPWAEFREPGLQDIRTCTVVVLPECIFGATKVRPQFDTDKPAYECNVDGIQKVYDEDHEHFALIDLIRSSGLAR
jgi:hypothetical protein